MVYRGVAYAAHILQGIFSAWPGADLLNMYHRQRIRATSWHGNKKVIYGNTVDGPGSVFAIYKPLPRFGRIFQVHIKIIPCITFMHIYVIYLLCSSKIRE